MAFGNTYDSEGRKFCLHITVTCKQHKGQRTKFRVWAEEKGKPNSKYADREIFIENGKRSIFLSFPISPQQLFIGVVNADNPTDSSFDVMLLEAPLRSYNIQTSAQTDKFLAMAENFSKRCGYEPASENGREFSDREGEFLIKYFPVITDRGTGNAINTPARIGNKSGIIEAAKCKFERYTIPMRIMILLHEYSHKYRNPKIGLPVSSEKGADVNGLYVYLGEGFSKVDAIVVFAKVFLKAQTEGNRQRMRLIMDYIKRFEAQEFAERLT